MLLMVWEGIFKYQKIFIFSIEKFENSLLKGADATLQPLKHCMQCANFDLAWQLKKDDFRKY
jgi:hypothetical protein